MKLLLTPSADIGGAKAYLLREVFRVAAQKANITIVENVAEADVVIVFGSTLPNSTALEGKKVFFAREEAVMNGPEAILADAQVNAVPYAAPKAAAGFSNITDGVKNIVAVTACPTGVAHTFMSAEAIETYAKKQGWKVKVETRGQVGAGKSGGGRLGVCGGGY